MSQSADKFSKLLRRVREDDVCRLLLLAAHLPQGEFRVGRREAAHAPGSMLQAPPLLECLHATLSAAPHYPCLRHCPLKVTLLPRPRVCPQLCYEELKERALKGKELSDGATKADLTSKGAWKWRSYDEWRRHSWAPRVLAQRVAPDGDGTGATPPKQGRSAAAGMRTVVGAGRR